MPTPMKPRNLVVLPLLVALLAASAASAQQLSEDFNMPGTTLPSTSLPAGWIARNQSTSPPASGNLADCFHIAAIGGVGTGASSWPTHEGAGMAYATFACATGANPVSGFLISPELDGLENGVEIRFQTRADTLSGPTRPDRLQVLLCLGTTCGDSGSTGSSPTDLGQFSSVLLDINPGQAAGIYPLSWSGQSITLADLPAGTHTGRIAFRFVAPNGGPSGNQGSRVGIDSVVVSDAPLPVAGITGWSNDPALNLLIADRSGEETQAKILPRADGGFYVSWFDNTDGGYDVRLQRLDGEGRELWPHNGILVADRNVGSTTDYGFSLDAQGNALLSFQCCTQNAADERIVAVKVTADGAFAWSDGGIPVSTLGEGNLISYITGTSDGNAVVVWMNSSGQGRAQKLSTAGAALWGATGITLPGPASGLKFIADVAPALNGDAIVAWSNQAGSARILRAQKLASADGAALWGKDGVRVSDAGGLGAGYFPKIILDGSGGAVFAYTDFVGTMASARVQRIDAGGNRLLGNDGVLVTTDASRGHYSPAATYDATNGDIHVIWIDGQQIDQQLYDGLYAQRIDSLGTRLYGETGKEIVPMTVSTDGTNALSQLLALPAPGGFLATWVTGNTSVTNNAISTARLGPNGDLLWTAPAHIKTGATKTSRLTGATSTLGYAAFTWSDAPDNNVSTQNIRAQNLLYTGAFGDTILKNGFDD